MIFSFLSFQVSSHDSVLFILLARPSFFSINIQQSCVWFFKLRITDLHYFWWWPSKFYTNYHYNDNQHHDDILEYIKKKETPVAFKAIMMTTKLLRSKYIIKILRKYIKIKKQNYYKVTENDSLNTNINLII